MIEKLVVDRYLTIPTFDQTPPPSDPSMPADFVVGQGRTYNIKESVTSGVLNRKKTSDVDEGAHMTKTHRTFRWLPWVPGKVSCVRLAGSDILTGLMTGCWLVIFKHNGVDYAGHIGTELDAGHPNSVKAKAAWRNAVNAKEITPAQAFNPVGPSLPGDAALNLKKEPAEFYGVITASGDMHTLVMTVQGHATDGPRRIAKVVKMPTSTDVTKF